MPEVEAGAGPALGENLEGSRRPIERALHAPGYIYSAPEILAREKEAFFMRDWLFVGRVEELAEPGDYMTLRIVGEPIIVARDRDGGLGAFYNMCVHRGVEVAQGKGNARTFKCPYHGWIYDLSGQLKGAAFMEDAEGFDIASCRMKPLALEVWLGNVFVSFNPDPPPIDAFLREFEADFGLLRIGDCRLANRITLDLDCNWKLVSENLMDFYHVGTLHAGTFGSSFSWEEENVHLKEKGGLTIWYDAGPPTPKAEPLLGKMPWLEDKAHSFACTGFLAPNLTLFGRIDCVRLMIAWPQSVDCCQVIIYHLFPTAFFARPDFEAKRQIYHDYQIEVLEEDRSMMEPPQAAMTTRGYQPGPMSTLETPIHNYLQGHMDRIFGPVSEGGRGAGD